MIMTKLQKIIGEFGKINGVKFVAIKGYGNKYGEVSDYLINIGPSITKAKTDDLEKISNVNKSFLVKISKKTGISYDVVVQAYTEMTTSMRKNLNPDLSKRTTNSQAQTVAYEQITKGVSVNWNTRDFYIDGFVVTKKVLIKGTYPEVKSRPKTLAKKAISKSLDFRMNHYRRMFVSEIKGVNLNGNVLTFEV